MSHRGDSQGEGSDSFISREAVIPRLSLGHGVGLPLECGRSLVLRRRPGVCTPLQGVKPTCRERTSREVSPRWGGLPFFRALG